MKDSKEILGISEGMYTDYGIHPLLFTTPNRNIKPTITDFFPEIQKDNLLNVAHKVFVNTTLNTEIMRDYQNIIQEKNEEYSERDSYQFSEGSDSKPPQDSNESPNKP